MVVGVCGSEMQWWSDVVWYYVVWCDVTWRVRLKMLEVG